MANLKYSRQRACIKEYLANTNEHPTADAVYLHVKEKFPNISLGTVYRNLNLLADRGEIVKISTPDGGDRYDGHLEPHYHVVCTECGEVEDLDLDAQKMSVINDIANERYDGSIEGHSTLFYGTCPNCLRKMDEEE